MPVTQDFAVIRKCWRQLLQSSPHWQAFHCLNLLIRHAHRSDEQGDGIAAASRPQQLPEHLVILSGGFACTGVQSVRRFVDCCLSDLLAQFDRGLKGNSGTGRMPIETARCQSRSTRLSSRVKPNGESLQETQGDSITAVSQIPAELSRIVPP